MNKKIGAFIQQLRKENKLTQEQLAEKLGVSNRSVSRWENGTTLPDISLMKCICEEFHISISELINGERQILSTDVENVEEKILIDLFLSSKNMLREIKFTEQFDLFYNYFYGFFNLFFT